MLEIKDLKCGYGPLQVIWGIDLKVAKNEIVAIIGPNGSGKSTILKSVFKLCDIYSGEILFQGKDLSKTERSEIINRGISYAPQGKYVFNSMTVKENIEMGGFKLRDHAEFKKRLADVYKTFPILKKKADKLANTLSGGEKQILSIARALVMGPKLLMLDEPTLGLSPKSGKEIIKKILEINREKNISILIVEQNAKKAVEIADRTYIIERGEVALVGGKEILNDEKIRKIYFGGV